MELFLISVFFCLLSFILAIKYLIEKKNRGLVFGLLFALTGTYAFYVVLASLA